jgi:hypothetical protein
VSLPCPLAGQEGEAKTGIPPSLVEEEGQTPRESPWVQGNWAGCGAAPILAPEMQLASSRPQ